MLCYAVLTMLFQVLNNKNQFYWNPSEPASGSNTAPVNPIQDPKLVKELSQLSPIRFDLKEIFPASTTKAELTAFGFPAEKIEGIINDLTSESDNPLLAFYFANMAENYFNKNIKPDFEDEDPIQLNAFNFDYGNEEDFALDGQLKLLLLPEIVHRPHGYSGFSFRLVQG